MLFLLDPVRRGLGFQDRRLRIWRRYRRPLSSSLLQWRSAHSRMICGMRAAERETLVALMPSKLSRSSSSIFRDMQEHCGLPSRHSCSFRSRGDASGTAYAANRQALAWGALARREATAVDLGRCPPKRPQARSAHRYARSYELSTDDLSSGMTARPVIRSRRDRRRHDSGEFVEFGPPFDDLADDALEIVAIAKLPSDPDREQAASAWQPWTR